MNLLVTSAKGLEARASAELKELALISGMKKVSTERSSYDGVIEADVEDPRALLKFLADYVRSEPFRIRFILRAMPIDTVVDTKIEEITAAVKRLSSGIGHGETFRITIEARDSPYPNDKLIGAIADLINRKVDLASPKKIVFVQVFGEYTGISVVAPHEILSVVKLKRGS